MRCINGMDICSKFSHTAADRDTLLGEPLGAINCVCLAPRKKWSRF